MSDTSSSHTRHGDPAVRSKAGHSWNASRMAGVQDHPIDHDEDPFTEWLLEHPRIDADEFNVLFAIHKLNARPHRSAWTRRTHLCRSTGLSQVHLTQVLNDLRHRGLVGISRHPVDSSRARYVLIVG